jgi:hypothetical protein
VITAAIVSLFAASILPFNTSINAPAAGGGGGGGLLLDAGPSAYAAYSATRKLRAAYGGSALRVRRSSDNSEQDIGFSSDLLDESTLTTFVGANDGFVVTLYDQSGNSRDLTQATVNNQPQIVSSGSVIVDGDGNPWMAFDGSNDIMTTAGTFTQALPMTSFVTASFDSHTTTDLIVYGASTTLGLRQVTATGDRIQMRNGASLSGDTYSLSTHYLITANYVTGNDSIQLNNATAVTGTGGDNSLSAMALNAGNGADMNLSEWVLYAADVTGGDLSTVQGNINTFYTLW